MACLELHRGSPLPANRTPSPNPIQSSGSGCLGDNGNMCTTVLSTVSRQQVSVVVQEELGQRGQWGVLVGG